jgi:hypothetical protein
MHGVYGSAKSIRTELPIRSEPYRRPRSVMIRAFFAKLRMIVERGPDWNTIESIVIHLASGAGFSAAVARRCQFRTGAAPSCGAKLRRRH